MIKASSRLLLALSALSLFVFSDPVGKVVTVAGKAYLQKEGQAQVPVKVGSPVNESEYVITLSGSKVQIKMNNDSDITVGPSTKMKIQKGAVANREGESYSIGLMSGSLKTKINKLASPNDSYKIHTPTSVAGIRGTDFSVATGLDGSSVVTVDEGKVNLETPSGAVDLGQNQSSSALIGSEAAPAAAAANEDVTKWLQTREENVAQDPAKAMSELQAHLEKMKNVSEAMVSDAEKQSNSVLGTNKAEVQAVQAQGLALSEKLNQQDTVNDGVLANAQAISEKYKKDKAVVEKLNGIQRINKMMTDYNNRINASLAALDARLDAAYKRIDESWKANEGKMKDSFDKFDKNFKDFETK